MCDSTHCDPGDENDYGRRVDRIDSDALDHEAELKRDDDLRHRAHLAAFVNDTSFAEEISNLRRLAERNYNADPNPEWPTAAERLESFCLDVLGWHNYLTGGASV